MDKVKKLSMIISGIALAIIFSWTLHAATVQTPVGTTAPSPHIGHLISESDVKESQGLLVVPPSALDRKTVSVAGGQATFLATGQETGEQFELADFSVPVGAGLPLHINTSAAEAFYILEGELTIQFEEQTVTAAPGTFVYLPKGRFHAIRNSGKTPVRTLSLLAYSS